MARQLTCRGAAVLAWLALAGCDQLVGFGGAPTPLARVRVEAAGALPATTVHPRAALVWGAQWLPELFCVLPPESPEAAAAIQAGCPDSFGFVAARVAAEGDLQAGTATLELFTLPGADVMVGDVTARVAYGSLVVYDDRNGSGALELSSSVRDTPAIDGGADAPDAAPVEPLGSRDVVLGASFVSMTQPDQRLAYREGDFNAAAAFYPRNACPAPPAGFSMVAAGGFTKEAALAAVLLGKLPDEDPATCRTTTLEPIVSVPVVDPQTVAQVICSQRTTNGVTRYRAPPGTALDFASRTWACAGLPVFPAGPSAGVQQLVVAGPATNACKSLTHYTLRGCNNDPACAHPDWDVTASPPSWWPCKVGP